MLPWFSNPFPALVLPNLSTDLPPGLICTSGNSNAEDESSARPCSPEPEGPTRSQVGPSPQLLVEEGTTLSQDDFLWTSEILELPVGPASSSQNQAQSQCSLCSQPDTKLLWSPRRELPTMFSSDKRHITMQASDWTNTKVMEVATRDKKLDRLPAGIELQLGLGSALMGVPNPSGLPTPPSQLIPSC